MTSPEPDREGGPLRPSLTAWWNEVRHAPRTPVRPAAPSGPLGEITDSDEWFAEMRRTQTANKRGLYLKQRPTRYANASYATLTAYQAHSGKVARWLDSGPRALLLCGPSRTGKTTAAYSIGNDANAAGKWVVARSAAEMSAALKPDGDPMAYQYAVECDLLILDDLGRERVTDWWLEQLQRLVEERCGNQRRIISTTNTDGDAGDAFDQLAERYGHPVAERLVDGGGMLLFDGPAVREIASEW